MELDLRKARIVLSGCYARPAIKAEGGGATLSSPGRE